MNAFVIKGDIICNENKDRFISYEDGYVVCADGMCKGVFKSLPETYKMLLIRDFSGKLVIPGMADIHVHAPQYSFRGTGLDMELIEWLNTYVFPEEAKYKDIDYADIAYGYFADDLKKSSTTRAVVWGTMHSDATKLLMDKLEETGIITYVGKVNMDRNSSEQFCENSVEEALKSTEKWLDETNGKYKRTKPIITPRFIPSCSDELMHGLGKLSKQKKMRIQSHLSENRSEVEWVKELVPESECYAGAYEMFEAMGSKENPAIMAHCVYSGRNEIEILKNHGTYIAHCPGSNMNLLSGIAPVRTFLNEELNVGIGTDVAGGSSLSMFRAISETLQASKMYYRLADENVRPLTLEEAFYLATCGGGSYFGKVGTFKGGYEFDALVIDDSSMHSARYLNPRERAERICYDEASVKLVKKYVCGKEIIL